MYHGTSSKRTFCDGSFDLTQDQLSIENVIEQLENMNTDIRNMIKSTDSRNTRKNTNWSLTTLFNDWRFAKCWCLFDFSYNTWNSLFFPLNSIWRCFPAPPLPFWLCGGVLLWSCLQHNLTGGAIMVICKLIGQNWSINQFADNHDSSACKVMLWITS